MENGEGVREIRRNDKRNKEETGLNTTSKRGCALESSSCCGAVGARQSEVTL